jgi:hypothetical protein
MILPAYSLSADIGSVPLTMHVPRFAKLDVHTRTAAVARTRARLAAAG